MSDFRGDDRSSHRLTPWVARLLAVNAIVLLLQQTVFTSDALTRALEFDPAAAMSRPWTFLTYMFVHGGILHLAANSIALFAVGPAVERRMGSATFIMYYLYCGIGAAIFTVALQAVGMPMLPYVGASGAIIGVAYAFARLLPDAELLVFPVPVPVRARWVVAALAAFDLVGLFLLNDNIAHGAHLGGLMSAALYFVLRGLSRPPLSAGIASAPRPRAQVAAGGERRQAMGAPARRATAPAATPAPSGDETAEIDRVLDKISASGIESLTAEERRFLDSVARRRRDLPH